MQNDFARVSLMPSALVLSALLNDYAGDPPFEALEQAGFRRNEIGTFLERRARMARSGGQPGATGTCGE